MDSLLGNNFKNYDKKIVEDYEIPKLKLEKENLVLLIESKNSKNEIKITALTILLVLTLIISFRFYSRQTLHKKRYENLIKEYNDNSSNSKTSVKSNEKKSFEKLNISESIIESVLDNLKTFEASKSYLRNNLTLNSVAKELNTNSTYLSKIINHHKKDSFSNYIAELRINFVLKELKENKKFRNYTIKSIADDIGFNRPESFAKVFFQENRYISILLYKTVK